VVVKSFKLLAFLSDFDQDLVMGMVVRWYIELLAIVEQDLHGLILVGDNHCGHIGSMATRWKKEH
jgi:hypothetical protein